MKKIFILIIALCSVFSAFSEEVKPTKNIILMIPDGTSISAYSASRLMKKYRNEGNKLNIDPYICGTVNTFSSNAPIGDSAPTSSCYVTGITGRAGNISIYPMAHQNDLIKLNPDSAYQPLATIAEGMKIEQKKSVGLVFTCQFPHATPSDMMAHFDDRGNYPVLAQQLAYNDVDVVFGGGTKYITPNIRNHFKNNGTTLITDDRAKFDRFSEGKVWGLFGKVQTDYELDRNPRKQPSIAEMTEKAIQLLNKNEKGFFLMVEGSKVDWAAHANDPVGIISEFIAFDQAFGKALDFAKKDGNTTIVVLSDHGNSGFSIGRSNLPISYSKMSLKDLFSDVDKIKKTAYGLEKILLKTDSSNFSTVFEQYTNIKLTEKEFEKLLNTHNYKKVAYDKVANSQTLQKAIIEIYKNRLPFGFTTGGHTGEEVLLSIYNPNNQRATGNMNNRDIHNYLYKISGLKKSMQQITGEIFAKHTDVFVNCKYQIVEKEGEFPVLNVWLKRGGKKAKVEIPAYSSVIKVDEKQVTLNSIVVYMDKNRTFYLPKDIISLIIGN